MCREQFGHLEEQVNPVVGRESKFLALQASLFVSGHVLETGNAVGYVNYLMEFKSEPVKEFQRFVILNMDVRDDRDWNRAIWIVVPVIRR